MNNTFTSEPGKEHIYPKNCFDPNKDGVQWWNSRDVVATSEYQKEWSKRRPKSDKITIKQQIIDLFEECNIRTATELGQITKHYTKFISEVRALGYVIIRIGTKDNAIFYFQNKTN